MLFHNEVRSGARRRGAGLQRSQQDLGKDVAGFPLGRAHLRRISEIGAGVDQAMAGVS